MKLTMLLWRPRFEDPKQRWVVFIHDKREELTQEKQVLVKRILFMALYTAIMRGSWGTGNRCRFCCCWSPASWQDGKWEGNCLGWSWRYCYHLTVWRGGRIERDLVWRCYYVRWPILEAADRWHIPLTSLAYLKKVKAFDKRISTHEW